MTNSIEALTDKLISGEITREEFLAEQKRQAEAEAKRLAEVEVKERKSRKTHSDAYDFVADQLQVVNNKPNPHVLVDLLALFVKKVEDQTGYVANVETFADYRVSTLDDVMKIMSVLRNKNILFPSLKASRTKLPYGNDGKTYPINNYIFEYLFNEKPEEDVKVLTEDDF